MIRTQTRLWPRFSSRCARAAPGDAYFHAGAALGGAAVGRRAEAAAIFAAGAALDPLYPARCRTTLSV